jgi:hypothetical protein
MPAPTIKPPTSEPYCLKTSDSTPLIGRLSPGEGTWPGSVAQLGAT